MFCNDCYKSVVAIAPIRRLSLLAVLVGLDRRRNAGERVARSGSIVVAFDRL